MLTDLFIKNFAIIDSLHVTFGPGLNVLTGETGAGKSIIIGALGLILGARSSAEIIRTGEDEAVVEALFDLSGQPEIAARLAETGIDTDGELLVKRVVSRRQKPGIRERRAFHYRHTFGVSRLLVNIYGQHESQTLVRPGNHLASSTGMVASHLFRPNSPPFTDYGKPALK
jgi:DNA repair protein RecN (Recombination protein N)